MPLPLVAGASTAVSLGKDVGGFVSNLLGGGGNPWDKSNNRVQDYGHAASKGDVDSVGLLALAYKQTKYKQVRATALNYLQLLSSGRGYDGKNRVTVGAPIIKAAQAGLKSIGFAPTSPVGASTIHDAPTIGVGVAQAAPDFQTGVGSTGATIAATLNAPSTKMLIGFAVLAFIAYHAYKSR